VSHAISITHLSKRYGTLEAVSDLTLQIEPGSICGLLGQNGAGKTTTLKCLLGLAHGNSGEILFDGTPLAPQTFEGLSYVPERNEFCRGIKVSDYLEFMRRTRRRYDDARARELLGRFTLDPAKRVTSLSKGQATALALVLAFSIRPSFLILDEPASGLDPIHQRHVLDLIIEAAANGATVLFSSHQITQVERAADRVAILKNGKLIVDDSVDNLKSSEKVVEAVFDGDLPSLNGFATDARVRRFERAGRMLRVYVHGDSEGFTRDLDVLHPRSVSIADLNLEDIFMNAVTDPKGAI
jgi:ABC-2 type transport system ATP-binding protein